MAKRDPYIAQVTDVVGTSGRNTMIMALFRRITDFQEHFNDTYLGQASDIYTTITDIERYFMSGKQYKIVGPSRTAINILMSEL